MSPKCPFRPSRTDIVLILLGVATLVKIVWAMTSVGTCDPFLFFFFAKSMTRWGMEHLYRGTTVFNHTPMTGGLIILLYRWAHGYYLYFGEALKMASIVADVGLVAALLVVRKLTGRPPWWALGLFAISPVSIMVSGFHGNIDPVMVMFLFFAAVAVLKDQALLSGVMFAAACNVKIAPIMVAPVFIFYWMSRGRRAATEFMAASGALMLAGAAWGLIHCPAAFIRNVFGYGSYWGGWGITYWLRQTGIKAFGLMSFADLSPEQNHVITALKLVTMAGVVTLAWRRRKLGGLEFFNTLTAVFAWIFVFMPGAAVQYMVWYAPFVLLAAPRWWLALTVGATVYMARFYHSTAMYHFPWDLALPKGPEEPYWGPWTNLVWGTFIAFLCVKAGEWFGVKAASEIRNERRAGCAPGGAITENGVPGVGAASETRAEEQDGVLLAD